MTISMTDLVTTSVTRLKPNDRITVVPGDIVWSWCSGKAHLPTQTDHYWDGHRLWCILCHPEKTPPVV